MGKYKVVLNTFADILYSMVGSALDVVETFFAASFKGNFFVPTVALGDLY